jgi:subtilase family serine protease
MRSLARRALTISAAALLAACGGSQPPIGAPLQGAARHTYSVCLGHRAGMFLPSLVVRSAHVRRGLPQGLTPANFQAAYNLPSLTKGTGQIVAVVEICDNPNAAADEATYRSEFGLPSGQFYKFNQYGEQGNYPPARKGLGTFIDVDVEMVAATCPNCTIYLIEANGLDQSDLQTAEATAVSLGAHIVNNAWGCNYSGCVDKSYFDTKGVTYVALGAVPQPDEVYPADFDTVVAVGGTYLTQGSSGKRGWTEKVWKGAGGGCFTDDPKPAWQKGTNCSGRVSNDVSIDAWNVIAFDSYDGGGTQGGWINVGGTGVPTGLISGVFALAGNAKEQDGGRTFWSKKHQKHLYKLECEGSCIYGSRFSFADGWGSPRGIGAF